MKMKMDVSELGMHDVEEIVRRLEKFGALVDLKRVGTRIELTC